LNSFSHQRFLQYERCVAGKSTHFPLQIPVYGIFSRSERADQTQLQIAGGSGKIQLPLRQMLSLDHNNTNCQLESTSFPSKFCLPHQFLQSCQSHSVTRCCHFQIQLSIQDKGGNKRLSLVSFQFGIQQGQI